jgi:Tol biopolymer transport system component
VESTFYSFYAPHIQYLVDDLAAGVDVIENYNPPGLLETYVPNYLILYIEETEVTEADKPMAWPDELPPLQDLWLEQDPLEEQHEILIEGEMVILVYNLFGQGMTRQVFLEGENVYAMIARPILPHETPLRFHYNLPYLPLDYVPVVDCGDDPALIPSTQPTATPTLTVPQSALTGQGRIVFASGITTESEIYISDADGTNRLQLTNNLYYDGEPVWSPDGRFIAFTSAIMGNKDIFVMDADGRNVTQLTTHEAEDQNPSWSPDGSKITFSSQRDGNYTKSNIFLMNANGTGQTQLTDDNGLEILPVWSPDGNKIAFTKYIGTSGARVIIKYLETEEIVELVTYNASGTPRVSWSPDSLHLVIGVGTNTTFLTIRIFDLAGVESEVIELSNLELPGSMDWSADGRFIIFSARQPNTGSDAVHFSEDQSYFGNWNLYALDTTTNQILQLTHNQQDETSPSWWP